MQPDPEGKQPRQKGETDQHMMTTDTGNDERSDTKKERRNVPDPIHEFPCMQITIVKCRGDIGTRRCHQCLPLTGNRDVKSPGRFGTVR